MRLTIAAIFVLFLVTLCYGKPWSFGDIENGKGNLASGNDALEEILRLIDPTERLDERENDDGMLIEKRNLNKIKEGLNKIVDGYYANKGGFKTNLKKAVNANNKIPSSVKKTLRNKIDSMKI